LLSATLAAIETGRPWLKLLPAAHAYRCRHFPLSRSHTRMVLFQPPVTASRPSSDMYTERSASSCPSNTRRHCPVSMCHSRMVPSPDAVTARVPSALHAMLQIASV
jgi:hypothetical protein